MAVRWGLLSPVGFQIVGKPRSKLDIWSPGMLLKVISPGLGREGWKENSVPSLSFGGTLSCCQGRGELPWHSFCRVLMLVSLPELVEPDSSGEGGEGCHSQLISQGRRKICPELCDFWGAVPGPRGLGAPLLCPGPCAKSSHLFIPFSHHHGAQKPSEVRARKRTCPRSHCRLLVFLHQ